MRDPRYDILFEPVRIGPVTAKNRFYQVPQCNGMGYRDPTAHATMRGIKAEGGWGVVCTEQAEIHHTSEITPFIEQRIWDDQDIPALRRTVDAIHAHGALAGIELAYNGMNGSNLYTREVPMGPGHLPVATFTNDPYQARAMDKRDIANLRRWHKAAALRAKRAGFDIVYVYAAHGLGTLHHFLSRRFNQRSDEYGGSLENRTRLIRELIEDTREVVGDQCGVVFRMSLDELMGPVGLHRDEAHDPIGLIGDLPDLWDVTLAGWENDSTTSRFEQEGYQEPFVTGIKKLTAKPVVGVGRFTSPDLMVRLVRQGVLDMIGAARPSIADPFLPRKVEEGRIEDIRECIGCNICVSGDFTMSPIRCTQNPTMGEEWRRGWHPEKIAPKGSDDKVLVIGAGPAGLEAALALGQRGYEVMLAEAGRELGGRVSLESRLPGLSAWNRVRDYRVFRLKQMANVQICLDSPLSADDVMGFGFEHVAVATGAHWRRDGVARFATLPVPVADGAEVLTPDDLMQGRRPQGRQVLLYDDDHYYMGGVLAELLAKEGYEVTLATPAADVSNWTHATLEQARIQKRLLQLGVRLRPHRGLLGIGPEGAQLACVFTGDEERLPCTATVLVTAKLPNDALYQGLLAQQAHWAEAGLRSVTLMGDANAPAPIAAAVYAGHKYARGLDGPEDTGDTVPFLREVAQLVPWTATTPA
ncbi:FAD-dependent oxidoreductase [Ideonella oryzae]|uniref:FAD-dependent oxidoreductase n=1 Tax=Ideonella oryzae TaxID=2937441 RepID=A0ABT1BRE5_9BURK|nr:FAD-dependent oxidoreductase [Ideonella oryzae]MCO5978805.1 FAD-dependent oxidoreductase [Ideonella oryzae]